VTTAGISIPEAGAGGYGYRLHFGHGYHGKSYYGRQHYDSRQQYYGRQYRGYKSRGSYYRNNYHHSDHYRNQNNHRKHTLDGAYDNSSAGKYGDRLDYGWSLLEKGRPVEAQKVFAALASTHPSRGAPKIGYAVATTDMGQLSKGAAAMRRALRIDPDAVHYAPVNSDLQHKFRQLADYYDVGPASVSRTDRHFMAAALHYLGGEPNIAREKIHQSLKYGDSMTSTKNLKRIIEDREVRHGSVENEYESSGD
jgi:tetratricopeptide (TPR) repeat protein